MEDPRCALGVLFVHGIGSQRRGETLIQWTDAIVEWMLSWVLGFRARWEASPKFLEITKRRKEGQRSAQDFEELRLLGEEVGCRELFASIEVSRAQLQPEPTDRSAPASARLAVQVTGLDERSCGEDWLFAESYWAEAFLPPRFSEFARWALLVVPWTLKAQFATKLRRGLRLSLAYRGGRPWTLVAALLRPFLYAAYLVGGLALAVVLQALMLLLLVVAAIPIGWIREFLGKVQQWIAASLGDSFVLVQSPTQCAAIVDRVRRDVAWLASKSLTVVVIAHSQGAAVAHMALREGTPPEVCRLVTVGSGLGKLHELRTLMASGRTALSEAWLMLVCLVLLIALGPDLIISRYTGVSRGTDELQAFVVAISLITLLAGIGFSSLRSYSLTDQARDSFRLRGLPGDQPWSDYFTTADPVPNGRLFDEPPDWMSSNEVSTTGSALSDHTGYWSNPDGFVGPVVAELAAASTLPITRLCKGDSARITRARWRRRWRVRGLVAARLAFGLALVSFAWSVRETVKHVGVPFADEIYSMTSPFVPLDKMRGYVQALRADRPEMVGWALLAAMAALWYGLMLLAWRAWEHHDLRRLFARQKIDAGGFPFVAFAGLSLLPSAAAVALWVPTGRAFGRAALTRLPDLAGMLWVGLLASFVGLCLWESIRRALLRGALSTLLSWRRRIRLAERMLGGLLWLVGTKDAETLDRDLRLGQKEPIDLGLRAGIVLAVGPILAMVLTLRQVPTGLLPMESVGPPAVGGAILAAEAWLRFVRPGASRWLVASSVRAPVLVVGTAPTGRLVMAALGAAVAFVALLGIALSLTPGGMTFTLVLMGGMLSYLTLKEAWPQDQLTSAVAAAGVLLTVLTLLTALWPIIVRVGAWLF